MIDVMDFLEQRGQKDILYMVNYYRLFQIAAYFVRDADTCHDIVNDVCASSICTGKYRPGGVGESRLALWLAVLVRYKATDAAVTHHRKVDDNTISWETIMENAYDSVQ